MTSFNGLALSGEFVHVVISRDLLERLLPGVLDVAEANLVIPSSEPAAAAYVAGYVQGPLQHRLEELLR